MAVQKSLKINKDLLVYKAFYFFYFGAIGTINPYLPVYFRQIGLSAFAVGLLVGVRPIIQLASAPFWTVLADKFKKRKSILIMSIIAWLIMTIALVFVEPTEETCRLTARNRSHSVYVNYTTLKTGFFKRSNVEQWEVDLVGQNQNAVRTIRVSKRDVARNDEPSLHLKSLAIKYLDPLTNSTSFTSDIPALASKDGGKSKYMQLQHKIKQSGIKNQKRQFHQKARLSRSRSDSFFNISKPELQKNTTFNTSGYDLLKILKTKQAINEHINNINEYSLTTKIYSDGNNRTMMPPKANQQIHSENFDPYNMNGKSSLTSPQLADFFAKSRQNITLKKPPDNTKYYNMNGVVAQQQNIKIVTANVTNTSSPFPPLLYRNKSSRLHVNKPTLLMSKNDDQTPKKYTRIKKPNETLRITQSNLFKANKNEMKRLFVILLVLIVVGEFLETPSAPLSDASLLEYLGANRIHYGKQRLWGSLGNGISSFLVGSLLEHSRHLTCGEEFIDYSICFCAFTLLMLSNLVTTANFKFNYKDIEEKNHSVLSTVLSIHYISFLTGACYMGMCHGFLHNFLMWFLEDLGASKTLMGLAIGSRCSADLITFFVASLLIENLGQIKIVFIALISYGAIFVAYSSMTNPWFALAVEFLEGFTYAASWSACASYLAEAAPEESVTTMQGILQGVYWGLGTGSGAILGGHFIHTVGAYVTFRLAAVGSFVIALLFAATQWKWQKDELDDSLGIYDYFSTGKQTDTEPLLNRETDGHKEKVKNKERGENQNKQHSSY